MGNYREELPQLIQNSNKPIVVLFVQGRCRDPEWSSEAQKYLELHIEKTTRRYIVYTVCHNEEDMPFPEPKDNWVYLFAPGFMKPVYSNSIRVFSDPLSLNRYIEAIYKMMDDHDLQLHEALLTEEEIERLEETEKMLEEEEKDDSFPPTTDMIRSFVRDTVKSVRRATGRLPVFVPKEVAHERISICEGCEHFTEKRRCTECGCFMNAKVNLAASECPIGKWEQYE